MKRMRTFRMVVLCLVAMALCAQPVRAGFGDFFSGVKDVFSGGASLSDGDIVSGLKEALQVGVGNAVTQVGQAGGYLGNPQIRIPLPGSVDKSEKLLRLAGFGPQVDAFTQSMNHAAEKAAPEAKALFWQAIRDMSIDDARRILGGGDTAATTYFKEKTSDRLREVFTPIVHDSMAEVGTTRYFQDLNTRLAAIPLAGSMGFDLDSYVTNKALDGLFYVVGEEERKIRTNPAARTTELLKKVFGAD